MSRASSEEAKLPPGKRLKRYHVGDREMLTISQICCRAGLTDSAVRMRVSRGVRGKALLEPPEPIERVEFRGKLRTISEIADIGDVDANALRKRLLHGHDPEYAISACYNKVRNDWKHTPYSEHRDAQLAVRLAESWGGMTMQEIANIMGVSKQRVEQIERKALAKLKAKNAHLQEYLEALREREERQAA